jgi:hypothetical protein
VPSSAYKLLGLHQSSMLLSSQRRQICMPVLWVQMLSARGQLLPQLPWQLLLSTCRGCSSAAITLMLSCK